jgi:protein-S-isoprenylcysteine O-methyltransferase Ste14
MGLRANPLLGPSPKLTTVDIANDIAGIGGSLFCLLVTLWTLIRMARVDAPAPWRSRVVALGGTFAIMPILALPKVTLPTGVALTSVAFMLAGYAMGMISLSYLGRSFSIVPEARRLVMRGPYRLIRHPLYLAEMLTVIGVTIQHASLLAVQFLAIQIGLQIWRMNLEEQVLSDTFPAYDEYRANTKRLVPGVY